MTQSLIQAPSPTSLRVPPHHLEAERSVLGAILVQNDVLYRVVEHGLEARDFYKDSHQKIFELILFLSEKGEPVDLVTLTTALKDRNWYETVGGSQALTTLFEDSFAVANVSYYAKIVREKALLRRMIETVNEIACRAFEGVEDIEEFLDEAEQKVFAVSDLKLMRTFSSMHDILMENMHIIEELAQKKETITGLALGFHDLDRMTCGLQAGQLLIIAGRPAMGKTSLVLTATQFVALQRKAVVAFFS
ncbi:MAG: replicative DNA helicase, partial [Bdellovibrio sp.]|nr:replicative DNA helicase [Bdellovibrio sp.]